MSEVSTTTTPDSSEAKRAGKVWRIFREAHSLSLRDVAEKVGTSKSQLARIEAGKVQLSRSEPLYWRMINL
jgi:transcriptional regulator with XRE-family HTH domain